MHADLGPIRLRKPEPSDLEALFNQKNDPHVASKLGGFTTGYTRADIGRWIESHGTAKDEALYVITDTDDRCLGHVGLYKIDHRVRSAEYAIMVGEKSVWGKGIGRACTRWALRFGFEDLALHRIYLDVLETNDRALKLYESLGFQFEGRHRHSQRKNGRWVDLVAMAILEDEWRAQGE